MHTIFYILAFKHLFQNFVVVIKCQLKILDLIMLCILVYRIYYTFFLNFKISTLVIITEITTFNC